MSPCKKTAEQKTVEMLRENNVPIEETIHDCFRAGDIEIFLSDLEEMGGVEVIEFKDVEDSKPNSTGSLALDHDLIRPFPEGSIIEVFGDEGSGKTTLVLEAIGQAVKAGKVALFVDQERSLQRSLVRTIRTLKPYVDAIFSDDKEARQKCPIKLVRADSGEKALEVVRRFATAFPGSIVAVDSVDALVPEAKMSEAIGKANMGSHAKLMSEALRILVHDAGVAKSTVMFLNQKREKVGLVFGNPEITGGGRSLKFYSWQRISLLKAGNAQRIIDPDKNVIGHRVRYKIVKNKTGPTEGVEGDFPLLYGKGIFRELELIDQCVRFGLVASGGRGGKQVVVPLVVPALDENGQQVRTVDGELCLDVEEKTMSKFNASRRLLIDSRTRKHLEGKLADFREMMSKAPEEEDEIPDPEGT